MRKLPLWLGMAVLVIICGISAQVLPSNSSPRGGAPACADRQTVFSGNAIETFDVEVLGIIPQSPPVSSYIMVKVSGEAIERYGALPGHERLPCISRIAFRCISHTYPTRITASVCHPRGGHVQAL